MRQLACRIPLGVVKARCKYRFWPASLLYDWALSLDAFVQSVLLLLCQETLFHYCNEVFACAPEHVGVGNGKHILLVSISFQ